MPAHMQGTLIFHYNLKFYNSDGDGFDGVSLKRFVMQVSTKNKTIILTSQSCTCTCSSFHVTMRTCLLCSPWLVTLSLSVCTPPAVVRSYWTFSLMLSRPRSISQANQWNLRVCASLRYAVKSCRLSWYRYRIAQVASGVQQKQLGYLDWYQSHIR